MPFEVGTKVWLEGTNLRLPSNLTPKLAPKWYGPFEVAAQISKVAYKLKLPPTWKIHDVFYASLLTPYKETLQHGPNFLEPPPEITEGESEWEVEKIIKERTFGRWKKKQYLVRWKGYSPSYNEWVPEEDLHTPDLLAEFRKQSSNIRTLSLDAMTICPLSPTIVHPLHPPTDSLITSMATHTPPESTPRDESSTGERPSSRQGNSPPPLFIPPPPSIRITHTASEVRSPMNSQSNLFSPGTTPNTTTTPPFPIPTTNSPSPFLYPPPPESSSSHHPLRRSATYGPEPFLCALGQWASNLEVLPTLLERISSPEGQENTPSPQSSLSGFEGAVSHYTSHHSPTLTPTPSKVKADLAHFPLSPPESDTLQAEILEATQPPRGQIDATVALCKAIFYYKRDHPDNMEMNT